MFNINKVTYKALLVGAIFASFVPISVEGAASSSRSTHFSEEEAAAPLGRMSSSRARVKRDRADEADNKYSKNKKNKTRQPKIVDYVEAEDEDDDDDFVVDYMVDEAVGIESSFSSPFKRMVSKYIPQVVKIEISTADYSLSGTGFLFNAELGIILTNHHVVGTEPCYYTVILQDGEEFTEEEVEVIGISPNRECGDFAFLRVKQLEEKFPQMPIALEHTVKKHDPIAFMGNSEGSFCVEEGNVNGRYDFLGEPEVHSFRVQLSSRGGASGSPTFNRAGFINGLLWGGEGLEHTSVLPIHWPLAAYEMMMGPRGTIRPITFTSLGSEFDKKSIYEISKYYGVPVHSLRDYLPEFDIGEKELLLFMRNGFKADEGFDSTQVGDILLNVEDAPVGCDTVKLHKLMDGRDSVRIRVLRIDGQIKDLRVKPRVLTQKYPRSIELDCGSVDEATPETITHRIKEGAPIFFAESGTGMQCYSVEAISGRPTPTFMDFARVLHQVYAKEKRTAFILSLAGVDGKINESQEVDLSTFLGKPLSVTSMIEGHWRSQSLEAFLADA